MKNSILSAFFALAFAATTWAIDPAPPPTLESLNREVQTLTDQLREEARKTTDIQRRLDTVEKRLGESYRGTSPFDSVERRLEELEKDVDDLQRRR